MILLVADFVLREMRLGDHFCQTRSLGGIELKLKKKMFIIIFADVN